MNANNSGLFGDPAVRVNTVVSAVAHHKIWSICDDDYGGAMREIAALATQAALGAGCLPAAALGPGMEMDCRVRDALDGVDPEVSSEIPRCEVGVNPPCWRVETKDVCAGATPKGWAITIDRGGREPPVNTHARASCLPQGK